MTTEHASRRRFLQASGVAAVAALAGCGGGGSSDDGGGSSDADHVYTLQDERHQESVEISVGQTILWEGESGQHFIRAREMPEESDWSPPSATAISGSQTHEHTFEVAGTYVWECDYHPGQYTIEVTE